MSASVQRSATGLLLTSAFLLVLIAAVAARKTLSSGNSGLSTHYLRGTSSLHQGLKHLTVRATSDHRIVNVVGASLQAHVKSAAGTASDDELLHTAKSDPRQPTTSGGDDYQYYGIRDDRLRTDRKSAAVDHPAASLSHTGGCERDHTLGDLYAPAGVARAPCDTSIEGELDYEYYSRDAPLESWNRAGQDYEGSGRVRSSWPFTPQPTSSHATSTLQGEGSPVPSSAAPAAETPVVAEGYETNDNYNIDSVYDSMYESQALGPWERSGQD